MQRVGFFETADEVRSRVAQLADDVARAAGAYLSNGHVVLGSAQGVKDLLDPGRGPICQFLVLTDGHWVWPSSLAHYVERYKVELPREFIDDMRARQWHVLPIADAEIDAIGNLLSGDAADPHVEVEDASLAHET
ncbi:hypothetical protein [Promicromonospora sp. NPDC057488]|uniref:hypothetical protein n=1 Tax=Promicromonospora sp. NPDC057488 TaxID=3346147 RepID=UPI00367257CE